MLLSALSQTHTLNGFDPLYLNCIGVQLHRISFSLCPLNRLPLKHSDTGEQLTSPWVFPLPRHWAASAKRDQCLWERTYKKKEKKRGRGGLLSRSRSKWPKLQLFSPETSGTTGWTEFWVWTWWGGRGLGDEWGEKWELGPYTCGHWWDNRAILREIK